MMFHREGSDPLLVIASNVDAPTEGDRTIPVVALTRA